MIWTPCLFQKRIDKRSVGLEHPKGEVETITDVSFFNGLTRGKTTHLPVVHV